VRVWCEVTVLQCWQKARFVSPQRSRRRLDKEKAALKRAVSFGFVVSLGSLSLGVVEVT
jgi:hypothetical protein